MEILLMLQIIPVTIVILQSWIVYLVQIPLIVMIIFFLNKYRIIIFLKRLIL